MRVFGWDVKLASVGRPSTKPPTRVTRWGRGLIVGGSNRPLPKPTPKNLRRWAETPVMRRCINTIKNEVLDRNWVVGPPKGMQFDDLIRHEIRVSEAVLEDPNDDDTFYSFTGQILEDLLTPGTGVIETARNGNKEKPWWLWPVDAATIELYPDWDGKPTSYRYAQRVAHGLHLIPLRDEQIIYIRPNPRTFTPFGLSPAEVAFNTINAFFAAFEAARRRASNERPDAIVYLGDDATPEYVEEMRNYWIDDIEGSGEVPFIGGGKAPTILRLGAGTDEDLRLKYQEFLMRLIAISFDLSAGKVGLSRDINRSTKEGEMAEDEGTSINPWAQLIATTLTKHLIRKRLGFKHVKLYVRDDSVTEEEIKSRTAKNYWQADLLTADELREEIGRGPLPDGRGTLRKTELEAHLKGSVEAPNEMPRPDAVDQDPTDA